MNRFSSKPALLTMMRGLLSACLTMMLLSNTATALPPKLTPQQQKAKNDCLGRYLDEMSGCVASDRLSVDECYQYASGQYYGCLKDLGVPASRENAPPKRLPPNLVRPKKPAADATAPTRTTDPRKFAPRTEPAKPAASDKARVPPRTHLTERTRSSPTPTPTPQKR